MLDVERRTAEEAAEIDEGLERIIRESPRISIEAQQRAREDFLKELSDLAAAESNLTTDVRSHMAKAS
ncbi:hypothetical protein RSO01_91200 [Reyranella soli]|uniref:Uncharacterized protein n=1 Tax=Reyranella soli TaxID=1230389 RepID=A0A512NSN7_9HYPH|nr:hypothetical protein RSO01_91200 [Reyranella soli]